MSEYLVRPANSADEAALVAGNLAMAQETEGLTLDLDTLRSGVRRVLTDHVGARYLVATTDTGEVVGQLMLTTEWSDWRNRPVWWIQSVHVVPERRRTGVYRALYEQVRREARAEKVGGVRLYVDTRNVRAQQVYTRLGMNGDHYRVFEEMFGSAEEAP
jgi:GNAT superfamily N-acetyltransferase